MNDATCPRCRADNLTDYPVCDGCATVAHFTHRDRCLHCERKHDARTLAATRQQQREEIVALLNEVVALLRDE